MESVHFLKFNNFFIVSPTSKAFIKRVMRERKDDKEQENIGSGRHINKKKTLMITSREKSEEEKDS